MKSKVVTFPFDKVLKCSYCGTMSGEKIEGIGINKIVDNPLSEEVALGRPPEKICLDCLDYKRHNFEDE